RSAGPDPQAGADDVNRATHRIVRGLVLGVVVAMIGTFGARALAQAESAEDRAAQLAAGAAEGHDASAEAHGGAAHADEGPVPPDANHRWPGAMLLTIVFLFIAAAAVGPAVRAHAPPEMPPTHSHDEPPGASHHHGTGGTINPLPETVRELE